MSILDSPVAVLGAGSWGTALAIQLARHRQQPVILWGHCPKEMQLLEQQRENQAYLPGFPLVGQIKITTDLKQTLSVAKDILIVVPSHAFREVVSSLCPDLTPAHRLAWATKGVDPGSNKLLHQVIDSIIPFDCAQAVLSGPSFAAEVAKGLPTAITLAGNNWPFVQEFCIRLSATKFRVYSSQDMVGVQLGGAVKNVLAIATGISDGLGFGANARSALITRGLAEMVRLGLAMGAQRKTFMGLAGVGDLVLTCTDNQSRNRRFGLALGQGTASTQAEQDIGQVVEGIGTARQIHRLAKKHAVEMPITEQVQALLSGQISPQQAVENLLSRELKGE